jgi:predicted anti-sigma-YlaC factor YlaD
VTMRDCPDAAIRDLLPLFVSGRLDDVEQARVEAHLQGCTDCAAEVDLLRATVRAYDVAPLDAAAIASRIPTARAAKRARPFHSQPLWRVAAAITIMIAGTATTMLLNRPDFATQNLGMGPDTGTSVTAPGTGSAPESTIALAGTARPEKSISFGSNLSDLTDAQLEALLASVDKMDGTLTTDPEALVPRIGTDSSGRRDQ